MGTVFSLDDPNLGLVPYIVCGKEALFTDLRISNASIPSGFFKYSIRFNNEGGKETLERYVWADHMADVIVREQIDLPVRLFNTFLRELDEEDLAPVYLGNYGLGHFLQGVSFKDNGIIDDGFKLQPIAQYLKPAIVCGKEVLFTDLRINRRYVPDGFHAYSIRDGMDGESDRIENITWCQFKGDILSREEIVLPDKVGDYSYRTIMAEDFYFINNLTYSLDDYLNGVLFEYKLNKMGSSGIGIG